MYVKVLRILKNISKLSKSIDEDIKTLELLAELYYNEKVNIDKKSIKDMFNDTEDRVLIKIEELTWYKDELEKLQYKF